MILTGPEIEQEFNGGRITLSPFLSSSVNPNSYDYHLDREVRYYQSNQLDSAMANASVVTFRLDDDGYIFQPGQVYLARTFETIGSIQYVPSLIGKSSLGRLGVFLQVHADLGHVFAIHQWTLEIVVTQPIRLYPGMVVGQVSFWAPVGEIVPYRGTYGKLSTPEAFLGGVIS